jgi:hypothetical protein
MLLLLANFADEHLVCELGFCKLLILVMLIKRAAKQELEAAVI